MIGHMLEADRHEKTTGALSDCRAVKVTVDDHRHHHIFDRSEGGDQMMLLKDESYRMTVQTGDRGIAEFGGVPPIYKDLARRRAVEQANDIEQGALARSGRSHQREKFASVEV